MHEKQDHRKQNDTVPLMKISIVNCIVCLNCYSKSGHVLGKYMVAVVSQLSLSWVGTSFTVHVVHSELDYEKCSCNLNKG